MYGVDRAETFRFLFRLAAAGHRLDRDQFLDRLVVGIANRYGAATCSICRFGEMRKTVWASAGSPLLELSGTERNYLQMLNGRLVQHAADTHAIVSALDLDFEGDVNTFLDEYLPQMDIFAFPLIADSAVHGVLVLYLPGDATPLHDADIQALLSIVEMLPLADEPRASPARNGQITRPATPPSRNGQQLIAPPAKRESRRFRVPVPLGRRRQDATETVAPSV